MTSNSIQSDNDFSVWVPYGYVRRPHGLKGELRIEPYASPDEIPDCVTEVRLRHESGQILVTEIESSRPANTGDLMHFTEILDRNAAEQWQGASVEIPRAQLQGDDESLLLCELVGFRVFLAENGESMGVVQGLIDHGNQVLLAIDSPDRQRFIPAVEALISRFDRKNQAVILSLPEGLWDL